MGLSAFQYVAIQKAAQAVRFHMYTTMYGCTTEVAAPVNVGCEIVGCVTACESVADGPALVTALFVTECESVADGPADVTALFVT